MTCAREFTFSSTTATFILLRKWVPPDSVRSELSAVLREQVYLLCTDEPLNDSSAHEDNRGAFLEKWDIDNNFEKQFASGTNWRTAVSANRVLDELITGRESFYPYLSLQILHVDPLFHFQSLAK